MGFKKKKGMKQILIFFALFILSYSSYSQKYIALKNESPEINTRKFYIEDVIDKRRNKKNVGEIWNGTFKKSEEIDIEGGLVKAAEEYFRNNFFKTSDNQIKVDVHIKYLLVKQGLSKEKENGSAHIVIEFIGINGIKYETRSDIYDEVDDAFSTHEARIRRGFYECAVKFNNALKKEEYQEEREDITDNAVEIVFDDNKEINNDNYVISEKKKNPANRNIIAVGYLIGGMNLIGVDYEIRIHDYIGVHIGAGFLGYTGGIKVHTNKKKNSMFFNISWKDAGLGLVNGFGIEAGGRWVWFKAKDIGLLYQAGFFVLNNIDTEFERLIYDNNNAPPVSFSFGIGLSW